ncbi:hypothetical protein HDU91_001662 [Kappamyces sp. JEL0680]|nr:hypothetical protein HDU91_001662 [Kappamyces sp. JEL0680]
MAVMLPQIALEFGLVGWQVGIPATFMFIGAIVGSLGWGWVADTYGRRIVFLSTLAITGLSACLAAAAPSLGVLCALCFLLGSGIGGNLPIDGALFLELVPLEYQSLLNLLSIFWPAGQVVTSLLAWRIMPYHSCTAGTACLTEANAGWRYLLLSLGIITFGILALRVSFSFRESPKNLICRGLSVEAFAVLELLAVENGVELDVTERDFAATTTDGAAPVDQTDYSTLFTQEYRVVTVMIVSIWVLIAMGFNIFNGFLPEFLRRNGGAATPRTPDEIYSSYLLISTFGIPGSVVGMYLSDTFLGRRGTLSLSTLGTSLSLFLFTVSTTPAWQLTASCAESFLQNTMYGTLYSYTPELFPTKIRGKGVGLSSAMGRLVGSLAPVLTGSLIDIAYALPLYTAATMLFISFAITCILPVETKGVAAL